ncbi:hypothetical protein C0992_008890 [Termitomyces sp. T32_za158]|nr:hypothetical protein C0992_008890 [Termitomyces sp. T32_za158]
MYDRVTVAKQSPTAIKLARLGGWIFNVAKPSAQIFNSLFNISNMIPLSVLVSLTLLPFTLGQANDSALQIAAIEAHFKQSQIVPQLLPSFNPSAILTVNFAGIGDIAPGQPLTKEQTAPTPTVTVTAANSSVQLNGKYTIAMVDADVAGSDLSKGVNHHWLINGVEITGV